MLIIHFISMCFIVHCVGTQNSSNCCACVCGVKNQVYVYFLITVCGGCLYFVSNMLIFTFMDYAVILHL